MCIKRYNQSFPAMVVALFDEKKRVQSVHVTLLDNKTHQKAAVEAAKLKFGPTPESVAIDVSQSPIPSAVSFIAEGLETAMSVASTIPHHCVYSVLDKQNFTRIALNKMAKNVVLCLDNDLQDWKEDKLICRAMNRLQQHNKTVWVAMPEVINQQKTDFNHLLQQQGVQAIKQTLEQAKAYRINDNRLLEERREFSSLSQLLTLPAVETKTNSQALNYFLKTQSFVNANDAHQSAITQYLDLEASKKIEIAKNYQTNLSKLNTLEPVMEREHT